jgi:hyaluronan synthase/N-acetylglucosaminyltransferase
LPKAKAQTILPERISKWLKQQCRWSRSFYREILWNLPSIKKQPIYMGMELWLQTLLPFFLLLNTILFFYKGLTISLFYIILYFIIMLIISFIRVIYALLITKETRFWLFPLYALLHLFLLLPVRLVALTTLGFNGWRTRE